MATPVKPIEQLGISTQRALETFKLKYNTALSSMPRPWAARVGDLFQDMSLKDSYPVALDVQKYREHVGEGSDAFTILSKDVPLVKREFSSAALASARKLERGDHAYIRQWNRRPSAMARARVFLRNHITADLFATGEVAGSCVLDGEAFFSATHPINPFDPTIQDKNGNTTFANLQAAATPFNAANLTAEKTLMKLVPGPDGEELGADPDIVLIPTVLDEDVFNVLSVQDIILDAAANAGIRNPHYNRGMSRIRAPELPGAGATADWYLVASNVLDMAMFPYVIAEDTTDELRTWDKTSDFYKKTSHVKIESRILSEAAFLFPHGIRKVKGA